MNRYSWPLILATLLFAPQLWAANIFVSTTGSDAASGTFDEPLRTVPAALDIAAPGDTIMLREGVYAGGFDIIESNLTLRSFPEEYAVILAPGSDETVPAAIRITPSASGTTLNRLDIRGGYNYTVHVQAAGAQLRNLNLRDAGLELVRAEAATDFVLEHSTLSTTGRRDPERGVLVASRASSTVLRHNVFVGGYYTGVEITGGGDTALVERNYFAGPILAAISLDPAVAVSSDFIANAAPEPYAVRQVDIRNNFFHYLEGAAVSVRGSQQVNLFNNSVLDFHGIQPVGRFQSRTVDGTVVDNDSVTLANNLLTFASDSANIAWSIDSGAVGAHDFNDNVYFPRDGNVRFEYEGTSGGLPTWQTATGQADRSSITDPQLRHDLRLTATSPLVDAGRVAGAPAVDYDAEARSDGLPDIGADEYSPENLAAMPPDGGFAGTGISDGSGEGLFVIKGIHYRSGGGAHSPWFLALLVFSLLFRRRTK